jgi:hypothetical protein
MKHNNQLPGNVCTFVLNHAALDGEGSGGRQVDMEKIVLFLSISIEKVQHDWIFLLNP